MFKQKIVATEHFQPRRVSVNSICSCFNCPHSPAFLNFEKLTNSNTRNCHRSYIAYMEDFTISFTHGFTMKPDDRPEYVDMGGMTGDLIVAGIPVSRQKEQGLCKRDFWTSTSTLPGESCPFIVGKLNSVFATNGVFTAR